MTQAPQQPKATTSITVHPAPTQDNEPSVRTCKFEYLQFQIDFLICISCDDARILALFLNF